MVPFLGLKRLKAPSAREDAVLPALLALVAILVYANTLFSAFVLDDALQILENPYVQSWRYLPQILTTSPWSFEGAQAFSNYYRPLMSLGYLVCYQIFGPLPFGFHLVNVLLHAANVVLVFYLSRRLFGETRVAFVAALLFAVHPIHTEAVAFIAAVTDLQLTFFFLLTFLLYTRPAEPAAGFGWQRQLALAAIFALALLAKEPAITLPALAVVYEHLLREDRTTTSWRQKASRYAGLWAMALAYLALRVAIAGGLVPPLQRHGLTLGEVFFSAFALVGEYAAKLVWPAHLSAFYPFQKSTSLFEPAVLAGLAWLAAGGALFFLLWRRPRPAAFALVWLIVPLAPVLNARWMPANTFAERYLYLPSIGFCWLAGWAVVRLWDVLPASPRLWRRVLAGAVVLVCSLSAAATVRRNRDWRDGLTLYQRALDVFPEAHVLRGNLGGLYWNRGDFAAAEREWALSMAHDPDNVITLENLGILYSHQGRYPEALEMFERVVRLWPESTAAHYHRCAVYQEMGEVERALQACEMAVRLAPLNVTARNHLGRLYFDMGRLDDAAAQLQQSFETRPTSEAAGLWGEIHFVRGELERAEPLFRQAVELEPFASGAHFRLGAIYARQGRHAEAIREYEAGLQTDPNNAEALAALRKLRAR